MKKLFIFDLDGTLLDTSEGILYCYKNAAESIGLTEKTVEQKSIVIGGPLSDGFRTLYNVESDNQLNEVIKAYKELYKQAGTKNSKCMTVLKIFFRLLSIRTSCLLLRPSSLKNMP